eukprot:1159990-Pelagomonas_calceolata.AAC.5
MNEVTNHEMHTNFHWQRGGSATELYKRKQYYDDEETIHTTSLLLQVNVWQAENLYTHVEADNEVRMHLLSAFVQRKNVFLYTQTDNWTCGAPSVLSMWFRGAQQQLKI